MNPPTKKELKRRIEALEAEVAALRARPPVVINPQPTYPAPQQGWWQNPVTYGTSTTTTLRSVS